MPAGQPEKYTQTFIENEAVALRAYIPTATPFPFLKDFCYARGYGSQHISVFAQKNKNFFEALNIFKDAQETKLVFGGITKTFDGWFTFQTLKNVAGWRDKTELEHSGEVDTGKNIIIIRSGGTVKKKSKNELELKRDEK